MSCRVLKLIIPTIFVLYDLLKEYFSSNKLKYMYSRYNNIKEVSETKTN